MDNNDTENVFCVDCDGWRNQKYVGKNIYDGTLRYICSECGCENNIEDDSTLQIEK